MLGEALAGELACAETQLPRAEAGLRGDLARPQAELSGSQARLGRQLAGAESGLGTQRGLFLRGVNGLLVALLLDIGEYRGLGELLLLTQKRFRDCLSVAAKSSCPNGAAALLRQLLGILLVEQSPDGVGDVLCVGAFIGPDVSECATRRGGGLVGISADLAGKAAGNPRRLIGKPPDLSWQGMGNSSRTLGIGANPPGDVGIPRLGGEVARLADPIEPALRQPGNVIAWKGRPDRLRALAVFLRGGVQKWNITSLNILNSLKPLLLLWSKTRD